MKIDKKIANEIYLLTKHLSFSESHNKKYKDISTKMSQCYFIKNNIALRTNGSSAVIIEFKKNKLDLPYFKDKCYSFNELKDEIKLKNKKIEIFNIENPFNHDIFEYTNELINKMNDNILFTVNVNDLKNTLRRLLTLRINPGIPVVNFEFSKNNKKEVKISGNYGDDKGEEYQEINLKIYDTEKLKDTFEISVNAEIIIDFLNTCLGEYIAIKISDYASGVLFIDDVNNDLTNENITDHYSLIMPIRP